MVPGHFTEAERALLLSLARDSIRHGLNQGTPLGVTAEQFPEPLRKQLASFVTLEIGDRLRGCIGSLEAWRPLVEDVTANAFAAAFRDPRFEPLHEDEMDNLTIHISVLSAPEPMRFTSESDLLAQIRPGVDGLILEDQGHRGTFLPSVWESLPDRREFLSHLKLKAGLPAGHWSSHLTVERYTTESIP